MRALIAIPVFNEATHLPDVLARVRAFATDMLVIDDGSTDGTAALLRGQRDIAVITHPENRGYGQSLIDAFGYARRQGFDWVITMDCDLQHEPAWIPRFLEYAAEDNADVISGSRYLQQYCDDDAPPPERRQINETINLVLATLLNLELTDSFCGFKAHRVSAMSRLNLSEPGYAFPLQFWTQCVRAGLRIREVPVRRIYRDRSRSFGATLDDPAARLQHYLQVLLAEVCATSQVQPCESETSCCHSIQASHTNG